MGLLSFQIGRLFHGRTMRLCGASELSSGSSPLSARSIALMTAEADRARTYEGFVSSAAILA